MTKRQKGRPSEVLDRLQTIVRTSLVGYRKWPPRWQAVSAILAVSVIVGSALVWLLPEEEAPRARQYTAFKSCLLTNAKGISEQPASAVWQGMQQASLKTHSKVQYLANTEVKSTNAAPYLGTLIQTQCDLIIAVGDIQTAAVSAGAGSHPHTKFVVVGTTAHLPNVTSVNSPPEDVQNQIAELITSTSD
jgi:basic membrane lipoprotein Med (substrate-binding protein (PBP1-ABC) superfamily)